jgi:hypothetical protein
MTLLLIVSRNEMKTTTQQGNREALRSSGKIDHHVLPGVLPCPLLQDISPVVIELSLVWRDMTLP